MKRIISTLALSTMLVSALSAASEPGDPIKDRFSRFIRSSARVPRREGGDNIEKGNQAFFIKGQLLNLVNSKCKHPIVQFLLGGVSKKRYTCLEVESFIENVGGLMGKMPVEYVWKGPSWAMNYRACTLVSQGYPIDQPLTNLKENEEDYEAFFEGKVGKDVLLAIESGELKESDLYLLDTNQDDVGRVRYHSRLVSDD